MMVKLILTIAAVFLVFRNVRADCYTISSGLTVDTPRMYNEVCMTKLKEQIQRELQASITYLGMSAYFGRDIVSRPGFSKYFRDSASEERGHAAKMIKYLLMRGYKKVDFISGKMTPLSRDSKVQYTWKDGGLEALKQALEMERSVTLNIRDIITNCSDDITNDFHVADWLSGDWLEHQLEAERELTGMMNTLYKLTGTQPNLGEYLYDRRLLANKPL